MSTQAIEKEYEAKVDSKRRILLREPAVLSKRLYDRYLVRHRNDGVIELRPQVMVDVASISEETLDMIDVSMHNFDAGFVSEPVNPQKKYPNLQGPGS